MNVPSQTFTMAATREVLADAPAALMIQQQVTAIEAAISATPDAVFDFAKALVESVCKTVLLDNGHTPDKDWNGPKLLREATQRVRLSPDGHPDPRVARDALDTTVRGLLQTIQGLCELRNNFGIASHGKDAYAPNLGRMQAELAARAADTIVSFLYRGHLLMQRQRTGARVRYAEHADFNDFMDDNIGAFRIGELEFWPSEVLYKLDPEAYRTELADYLREQQQREGDGQPATQTPAKQEITEQAQEPQVAAPVPAEPGAAESGKLTGSASEGAA